MMKTTWTCLTLALLAGCCPVRAARPVAATPAPSPEPEVVVAPAREALGSVQRIAAPSSSPIVSLRVVFDAGSAEDPEGRAGLTDLTARLMVEGGAGDLSYAEISERLFPMAAELGVQVDREQTAFVARVHQDHLEEFYGIFRDVLARPRMQQADFQRLRERAHTALTMELRGNDDEELGKELLQAMLYEGHPYGHPGLGSETALGEITLEDVRAHRARVLCGPRATVAAAGAYPEGFAERIEQDLSALRSDACVGRIPLPEPSAAASPRLVIAHKPEAQAVAISMGVHIPVTRDHEDYPAMVLAAAYLGQHRQFIGLLMQKIREQRGINYGDYAYTEHFEQDGWGVFPLPNTARRQQYFSIWIRPTRPEQAHFALRMAVRELRTFVQTGISAADFERVRDYVKGYYALFLQTESRRLGFAVDDAYYGAPAPYLERLRTAFDGLTAEQLNAAVRRHLDPAQLQIAMVASDASGLAAAIAADAPSPIEYPADVPPEVLAEDREIVRYPLGIPRDQIQIVPVADVFR